MNKCLDRLNPLASATEAVEADSADLRTVARWSILVIKDIFHLSHRYVDTLRVHWSNQPDFHTFNTPALQYLGPQFSF